MKPYHRLAVAFALMCAVFAGGVAFAASVVTETPGNTVSVYRGTTVIQRIPAPPSPAFMACVDAAKADAEKRPPGTYSYGCQDARDALSIRVTAIAPPPPPPPVPTNCVVSAWSAWTVSYLGEPVNGFREQVEVRTRAITTPPLNGGQPCPVLSETRTTQIPAQVNTGMPAVDRSKLMVPAIGSGERLVRVTGQIPAPAHDGVGAFRTACRPSRMLFDDPVVYPGQPGVSHLHLFFGNTGANGNTTMESLTSTGNSTCRGGIGNRSAYWVPAIIDTRDGAPQVPHSIVIYYKKGYNDHAPAEVNELPVGLRFLAGNSMADTGPRENWRVSHRFSCDAVNPAGPHLGRYGQAIPDCPAVEQNLHVMLDLPNCWDGVNLDSPDHRSHMARSQEHGNRCPATHPRLLPQITYNLYYSIPAGADTKRWRLSSDMYDTSRPGGYSMHGDLMFGWDPEIMRAWLNGCVRASTDCNLELLGDGRVLSADF